MDVYQRNRPYLITDSSANEVAIFRLKSNYRGERPILEGKAESARIILQQENDLSNQNPQNNLHSSYWMPRVPANGGTSSRSGGKRLHITYKMTYGSQFCIKFLNMEEFISIKLSIVSRNLMSCLATICTILSTTCVILYDVIICQRCAFLSDHFTHIEPFSIFVFSLYVTLFCRKVLSYRVPGPPNWTKFKRFNKRWNVGNNQGSNVATGWCFTCIAFYIYVRAHVSHNANLVIDCLQRFSQITEATIIKTPRLPQRLGLIWLRYLGSVNMRAMSPSLRSRRAR